MFFFCVLSLLFFLVYHGIDYCVYGYLKVKKKTTSKEGNLEMNKIEMKKK